MSERAISSARGVGAEKPTLHENTLYPSTRGYTLSEFFATEAGNPKSFFMQDFIRWSLRRARPRTRHKPFRILLSLADAHPHLAAFLREA